MPKTFTRPTLKLTVEQMREILRRAFEQEAKLTPKVVKELMKYEPPVMTEMGTLARDVPTGVGEFVRKFERLPIEEARAKYFASPQSYVNPTFVEPPAKEIAFLPPESPLAPSELAKRVAYERLVFKPIIPPSVQKSVGTIRKEVETTGTEELLKRAGVTPEDIRPGVKPREILAEKGMPTTPEVPPIGEVAGLARDAELLWKQMGGEKSPAGKFWGDLLNATRGVVRKHIATPKDYFVTSYYKWKTDPYNYKRKFPREAKLLERIEEQLGPQIR